MPGDLDIRVDGLREIERRMAQFPAVYDREARRTMEASLLVLQERVPPYPPALPDSSYTRTGQLGRSLGANMAGAPLGKADVQAITQQAGAVVGTFGTNLRYAPDVISASRQRKLFRARGWWTMRTIRDAAAPKIQRLWQQLGEDLARWLERGT